METPFVVTAIPCLNEERTIERCLKSLIKQDYPADSHAIHVIDGGSTDSTLNIVENMMAYSDENNGPKIHLLNNPEKYSPQARNLSLEACPEKCEFIFEMSAHAWVAKDHLRLRINDLIEIEDEIEGKVGGVGCRVSAAEEEIKFAGRSIEAALTNRLGAGGGQFARFVGRAPSKIPPFTLYRKEAVESIGGWDPYFRTTQDSDLNLRLNQAGWPTWRSDVSCVQQVKRKSVRSWIRFGHRYGFWRMQHLKRSPSRLNIAEFAPWIGVIATIILILLGIEYWWILAALYAISIISSGVIETIQRRDLTLVIGVPMMLMILHTTFSIGLLDGILRKPR